MNNLNIKFIKSLDDANIQSASLILNEECDFHLINCVNWYYEYPYCPDSLFYLARSNDSLFIKFIITEKHIKAVYEKDQEPVYEDSCVEFFCKKYYSDTYMNFEFNCIGTCIATTRKSRDKDIVLLPETQLRKIERFASLGNKAFGKKEGLFNWELTVKIPFEILNINPNELPDILLGNFYKCADRASIPHFVSWNPISTKTPDFHSPEFFGKLSFL